MFLVPGAALAAVPGAAPGLAWGLPFAGLLLSIALLPLLAPRLWHHHDGKVAALWAALFLVPFALTAGPGAAFDGLAHVMLGEYLPFITLLLALYVTGGGVVLQGRLPGTPAANLGLLALGTALASIMGTTGACMLLIRPLLRANAGRRRQVHIVVFFIFLVGNVGGALSPLGDPPLYLGFLQGVSFFWPLRHLLLPVLFIAGLLLVAFYLLDSWHYRREAAPAMPPAAPQRLGLRGTVNLALIGGVVATVLMQGIWQPGAVAVLGQAVGAERLLAMALFLAIAAASMALTPRALRVENDFSWGAMLEVARLFAAIFVTMAPVLAMLQAGTAGPMAGLVALTSDPGGAPIPWVYFWLTGGLSSFLDNAPTYLVFFNLAGGDAARLMAEGAPVLAAISAGAVFMGANSYIGNAPNFMVKAIAEAQGVKMPAFFGYLGWALVFLVPVFALATLIFFV
ncbi:sodium:proton antiporter [Roseomonas sp. 18066]|uniref:sodium:proton antiporter n=1 Tax=Roseomonas sp. 18066 TaxID=2681412 RepID=UPI001F3B098F|nr:sodium:proton antiporter [Roseomonas sp. 18066]